MKPILFIVFLLLSSARLYSQRSKEYFDYNGENLYHYLQNKMRYPVSTHDKCSMPTVYVKFRIKNNAVDSLTFSNYDDKDLISEISRELKFTNGFWNAKLTKGKWIVIPMMFRLSFEATSPDGCTLNPKEAIEKELTNLGNNSFQINTNYIYMPPLVVYSYGGRKGGVQY